MEHGENSLETVIIDQMRIQRRYGYRFVKRGFDILASLMGLILRTIHHKEQFPTEDSLDRFLVSQFNVYNEKSLKRIHRGFKGLQDTLEASFI